MPSASIEGSVCAVHKTVFGVREYVSSPGFYVNDLIFGGGSMDQDVHIMQISWILAKGQFRAVCHTGGRSGIVPDRSV